MNEFEAVLTLGGLYVGVRALQYVLNRDWFVSDDLVSDGTEIADEPERAGATRIWCDYCMKVVTRDARGRDQGHRSNRCSGTMTQVLPPAWQPGSSAQLLQATKEVAGMRDRELREWLVTYAGTADLNEQDLDLFREQLDLVRRIEP